MSREVRIAIIDDEHAEALAKVVEELKEKNPEFVNLSVRAFSEANEITRQIQQANARSDFPYDIVIADVFMPLEQQGEANSQGGGLAVYDCLVAKSGQKDWLRQPMPYLILISNRWGDAMARRRTINENQQVADSQWVVTLKKPESMKIGVQGIPSVKENRAWVFFFYELLRSYSLHEMRTFWVDTEEISMIGPIGRLREELVGAFNGEKARKTDQRSSFYIEGADNFIWEWSAVLLHTLIGSFQKKTVGIQRVDFQDDPNQVVERLCGRIDTDSRGLSTIKKGLFDELSDGLIIFENVDLLFADKEGDQNLANAKRAFCRAVESRTFIREGDQHLRELKVNSWVIFSASQDLSSIHKLANTKAIKAPRLLGLVKADVKKLSDEFARKQNKKLSPDAKEWLASFWPRYIGGINSFERLKIVIEEAARDRLDEGPISTSDLKLTEEYSRRLKFRLMPTLNELIVISPYAKHFKRFGLGIFLTGVLVVAAYFALEASMKLGEKDEPVETSVEKTMP